MIKYLMYSLGIWDRAELDRFCVTLSPEVLRYRIGASDNFRIPEADKTHALEIHRRARAAQLNARYSGEVSWTPDDFREDRICTLDLALEDSSSDTSFLDPKKCPVCEQVENKLRPDADITIRLAHSPPPIFSAASGWAMCIDVDVADQFRAAGLMSGAETRPVNIEGPATKRYALLASNASLGALAGDFYGRRCSYCHNPLEGGGYFGMFRHPPHATHVHYAPHLGPTVPIVSGSFARAALLQLELWPKATTFYGWYPEDQAASLLPDLDRELAATPTPA